MIHILAITPYEGLGEALQIEAESRNDLQLTVKTGNLQSGVEIARESFYKNYDIILSRGGTARLLSEQLDIPVIEIPISVYDMLRAIKLAEHYSGKFAIVGYENITACAHTLCDLLQYQIDVFTIDSDSNVMQTLSELREQNYQMVLCDMISSISARELGMNSLLITSGPESIHNAFDHAVQLYRAQRFTNMQKELFRDLIFESGLNVMLFNSESELLMSSFNDNGAQEELTQYVQQYISTLASPAGILTERKFGKWILQIESKALYCQDQCFTAVYVHKKEAPAGSSAAGIYTYTLEELRTLDNSGFCGNASYVGSLLTTINDYAAASSPVLIVGESGTGKDKSAAIFFETSEYRRNLYHIIDCRLVSEKKWTQLLASESSPFCSTNATIYLKNISSLTDTVTTKLITFIDDTGITKRNRLLFSVLSGDFDIHQPFIQYLMNQLSCLTLHIPPLRKRSQDIPDIASICINQLNSLTGKTIIGFHPDAMKSLQSFPWPQNLDQFKRVLKELVAITHTPYISKDAVDFQLKKEFQTLHPGEIDFNINLNQTLEEINYDIAHLILNKNLGNKGKTAESLGISRSTLWRMLKIK